MNASGVTVLDVSFKAFVGHPAAGGHDPGGTNAVTVAFSGLFASSFAILSSSAHSLWSR